MLIGTWENDLKQLRADFRHMTFTLVLLLVVGTLWALADRQQERHTANEMKDATQRACTQQMDVLQHHLDEAHTRLSDTSNQLTLCLSACPRPQETPNG